MLTAGQYEAVGRFTPTFNQFEAAMETYAPLLGGTPATGIMLFGARLEWFEKILRAVGDDPDVVSCQVGLVRKLLDNAKRLSKKRNEYVHALVLHDFATNETRLRIKGAETVCDEAEVRNHAAVAAWVAHQFCLECEKLIEIIEELRA